MTRILAAIDDDALRRQVLEAGAALAAVYGGRVEAVHVVAPGADPPKVDADLAADLRLLHGDVVECLVEAVAADDVAAAVIGARRPTSTATPMGHVAVDLATRIDKPLAVVPPDAPPLRPGQRLRALVPLDGTELAALTVRAVVRRVADADVDIVLLHVFGDGGVPSFLDRPEHDLPTWAEEFRVRFCDQPGSRVEWRRGSVGGAIADAARECGVDGIILGWGQELGENRARAVRRVIAAAGVPVILVPRAQAERTLAELGEP